jgi:glycosyltransferase involved in cell wall biosynthesis
MKSKRGSTLACVILTKNEEANIRRCLQSVLWCDEVVVVDSGSKDRTVEISRELGAKVVVHVPQGLFNIANQRNWALENTGIGSDWVLFLDADEEVTPALKEELVKTIRDPGDKNCFEITPKYLYWGTWLKRTQGYPNWHPRLLRKGAVGFEGGVWEHFDHRCKKGFLKEPYNHYANSKGFSDWLQRHDRYSSWDAERVSEFLSSGVAESLGTTRKLKMRICAARLYPLRPLLRFLNCYVFRLGFTEGIPGLVFALMYGIYEFMTVIKICELNRLRRGDPL